MKLNNLNPSSGFFKEYASAQHELEIAEASCELGFEFIFAAILAAFTGGTGAATLAPRLSAKMPKLGQKFQKLATAIKKVKLRKTTKGHTNKSTTTDVKRPEKKKLEVKSYPKRLPIYRKDLSAKWFDDDGNLIWPKNDGFARAPQNGQLDVGDKIDRYSTRVGEKDRGSFLSPSGVPYNQRALPYDRSKMKYAEYEVIKPIDVKKGKAASWFDQDGGGLQYLTEDTVGYLVKNGYLKQVK